MTAPIKLSVILVTSGRSTLTRTLKSMQDQLTPDDEVLVVGAGKAIESHARAFGARFIEDGPFGCWGQRERQSAMAHATGTHLMFIDDDDWYTPGAFATIRRAIAATPDRPIMFRMTAPDGLLLWIVPDVWCGNVSGIQFVVPNQPERLGAWGLRREGDYDFIQSTLALYPSGSLVWFNALIAQCEPGPRPH